MSTAVLAGAQLHDWIADSPEDYIYKAKEAARQVSSLRRNRAKWRQQLQQSPLGDPVGLLRSLEGAFSSMAQQHGVVVSDSEIQALG